MSGERIEILHGVNLNTLGVRDPAHYGTITLPELDAQIEEWAAELGMQASCFQTNSETRFVERLHALRGQAQGLILNPGSWTHYAWAIHDALEVTGLPAIEVHISDITSREPWRRVSVIGDLCLARISGRGAEGYREALELLAGELRGGAA